MPLNPKTGLFVIFFKTQGYRVHQNPINVCPNVTETLWMFTKNGVYSEYTGHWVREYNIFFMGKRGYITLG